MPFGRGPGVASVKTWIPAKKRAGMTTNRRRRISYLNRFGLNPHIWERNPKQIPRSGTCLADRHSEKLTCNNQVYFMQLLIAALILLIPNLSYACTVCFGGADGNLIRGFTWGVALLGSLPFLLMIGLVTLIVKSTKNRKHPE
ncbi:MAG: hypothetical protein KCHDKBKB_01826 [Elusimicrobia bacterium]|nr:hypothetical protein [Elusimicrobiota bacterium]